MEGRNSGWRDEVDVPKWEAEESKVWLCKCGSGGGRWYDVRAAWHQEEEQASGQASQAEFESGWAKS